MSSDQIFTYNNASAVSRSTKLQNLKFSCLYLIPFSHKVVPKKASGGGGGWGSGGGGGSGRIPHFNWSIYRGGNFFSVTRGKIGREID